MTISYRDAGVNIDNGNLLVEKIKPIAARTHRSEMLGNLGGFGALCEIPLDRYKKPVLVSGTDGVGTKLKLAQTYAKYDTIGIDLVAMCVNDIVTSGAEPLFFLDYYATGKLDVDVATQVVSGIGKGCELAGAALVGGETAEMPGMYSQGDYDLAGFSVGIVEKDAIIDGSKVEAGDALIGLASNGPHSNGYSLIRKLLEPDVNKNIINSLLKPTRIYVRPLLELIAEIPVHALAHITGGGLLENIPRVLPAGCCANINSRSWTRPTIFDWLQDQGNISDTEMYRIFNCGVGMVICLPADQTNKALSLLRDLGETAWHIGNVDSNSKEQIKIV